jgi:hypothetical protein
MGRRASGRVNLAISFTAQWMKASDTTTCTVFTDFAGDASGVEEGKLIASAQQRQVISKRAEQQELRRRNILGPDYDPEADEMQIAIETGGLEPEVNIDPRTGKPIDRVGNVIEYPNAIAR